MLLLCRRGREGGGDGHGGEDHGGGPQPARRGLLSPGVHLQGPWRVTLHNQGAVCICTVL